MPTSVPDPGQHAGQGGAVAGQPIRRDGVRHHAAAPQQVPEEALGRGPIPAGLDENVDHHPMLVDGPPEVVRHATDPDEHLILSANSGCGR
jgi:hypothetical protein